MIKHSILVLCAAALVLSGMVMIFCANACRPADRETEPDDRNKSIDDVPVHNTGGNPVIPEGSADPSVRVFDGRIYIYPSHDYSRDNDFWIMRDWKVYSTADLVNFTDHGVILKGTDIRWAAEPDHCWAPDCVAANGKYYFYFPVSDIQGVWKAEIGVAVADSPEGPFRDALGEPLIGKEDKPEDYSEGHYNIDPAVFTDDDGRSYLFWGNGCLFMAELSRDMISLKSEIQNVEILDHKGYREGPFVWKRRGLYYLLYSRSGSSSADVLDYATSDDIHGPYRFGGTIIGHGQVGNEHGSVFTYTGQWYVAYHDLFPTDKYRKTCLDIIHYRDNGDISHCHPTREGVGWHNAAKRIEAENYFERSADIEYREHGDSGFYISRVTNGGWLRYPNVKMAYNYGGRFMACVASGSQGGKVEIFLDSLGGEKAGELAVGNTGNWQSWQILETEPVLFTGTRDICLKFTGREGALLNLDWFRFE
jgi:hypothetical protein